MTSRTPVIPALDLRGLVADPTTRVVVTCGSGGVGKTTTAAAVAVSAADAGRKVAVLTIDPAKRLAQSLGLQELDNHPRRVELPDAPGELWAMMLDTRRTFDEMVQAHTTADRAAKILANPFYQTISSSFSGTQEYMAMEKLGSLAATGEFDVIVVDTPPSRSALDFLDAPERLSSFLDGRMIRMLVTPGKGVMKIVGAGIALFTKAVRMVIGGQMLADATQFVQLFEDLFGGFRERAEATARLLRRPGTEFVVVSTAERESLREAAFFIDRLRTEQMPLAGMVLNRTHPVDPALAAVSRTALQEAAQRVRTADPVAAAALDLALQRITVNAEEQKALAMIERMHPHLPVLQVPAQATDVHDVEGLRATLAERD